MWQRILQTPTTAGYTYRQSLPESPKSKTPFLRWSVWDDHGSVKILWFLGPRWGKEGPPPQSTTTDHSLVSVVVETTGVPWGDGREDLRILTVKRLSPSSRRTKVFLIRPKTVTPVLSARDTVRLHVTLPGPRCRPVSGGNRNYHENGPPVTSLLRWCSSGREGRVRDLVGTGTGLFPSTSLYLDSNLRVTRESSVHWNTSTEEEKERPGLKGGGILLRQ